MKTGRPTTVRAWSATDLRRMRVMVEDGECTMTTISQRFRTSIPEIRRLTAEHGWRDPRAAGRAPKPRAATPASRPVVFDVNNRPPGGIGIHAALQCIASAAWSRGAVIAKPSGTFDDLAAGDLMRALRGAWERSQGNDDRLVRVETIIRAVAARLSQPGPVQITPTSLGVVNSFAGILSESAGKRRART